jgi:UDP-hydrolysing UDP-N-acetyl-D-glucosamine 2-epimerase
MLDVAVVTVARSDWGIYRSVLRELTTTPGIAPRVLASGMHLNERFGMTVRTVDEEASALGIPVERVPMDIVSDAPADVAAAMGVGVVGFSRSFARQRPDILLVLGDRFEMFSAVTAAVPFVLPVFHIHGGERTAGAIDDALRHAMTKMSHVHFVSTRDYGRRVRQLGEDSWRIVVSGAPALDELKLMAPASREEAGRLCGLELSEPYLLVAFHPTTLEVGAAESQATVLFEALEELGMPTVFMMPNADPGGSIIRGMVLSACDANRRWTWVENLPFQQFATIMCNAAVFVGNSSSGIIEAPTFGVPVVNVGRRQEGRVRGSNVIDVDVERAAVVAAVTNAQTPEWRASHLSGRNPYDAGGASRIIAKTINEMPLDARLLNKGFVDVPVLRHRRPVQEFAVSSTASLRDVLGCINRNRCGAACVVDDAGRLLDVVTDGDVRRAMLVGETLESSVEILGRLRAGAGRTGPVLGNVGEPEHVWHERMIQASVRQLPIVDGDSVVDLVLVDEVAL